MNNEDDTILIWKFTRNKFCKLRVTIILYLLNWYKSKFKFMNSNFIALRILSIGN